MKCPHCNSTKVEESKIEIFETDFVNMVPSGFEPFALWGIFSRAGKKLDLAINGKKRYYCNNCSHYFEA